MCIDSKLIHTQLPFLCSHQERDDVKTVCRQNLLALPALESLVCLSHCIDKRSSAQGSSAAFNEPPGPEELVKGVFPWGVCPQAVSALM